jgi:monothiol glutaredoxin
LRLISSAYEVAAPQFNHVDAGLVKWRFGATRSGGSRSVIAGNSMEIIERIRSTVQSAPIVLFMKGTPGFPMCGFSSRTVKALNTLGAPFVSVNILADPAVRANLPRYSNWPTFPQLFIAGELIGGCDITLELFESGELERMVREVHRA